MTSGVKIGIGVSFLGLAAMVAAFLISASPYVTLKEARSMAAGADGLHVAGDMVPGTLQIDAANGRVAFQIKDANGDIGGVTYVGTPPANMGAATKVVAIGKMDSQGTLEARKLLLKCPSKYESETGKKPAGA